MNDEPDYQAQSGHRTGYSRSDWPGRVHVGQGRAVRDPREMRLKQVYVIRKSFGRGGDSE